MIVCHDVTLDLKQWSDATFIGVETGAIKLIRERKNIILACGDFDHTTKQELVIIKNNALILEILPKEKDILDSEYAIQKAIAMNATKIKLVVSGNRWGMVYSLIQLLIKYQKYQLEIFDDFNILKLINKKHTIFEQKDYRNYRYFDFLPLTDTKISLRGFKYPLKKTTVLTQYSNYFISNEINALKAEINLILGYGILTISKENKKLQQT